MLLLLPVRRAAAPPAERNHRSFPVAFTRVLRGTSMTRMVSLKGAGHHSTWAMMSYTPAASRAPASLLRPQLPLPLPPRSVRRCAAGAAPARGGGLSSRASLHCPTEGAFPSPPPPLPCTRK